MPTILHPWARVREEQQVDTLRFLLHMAKMPAWNIISQEMVNTYDYSGFLSLNLQRWKSPTFIVEQDIVPTAAQLRELMECYENACVIPYRLREQQWSLWNIVDGKWEFLEKPFPEFHPLSGLGFAKLSRRATQIVHDNLPSVPWYDIDFTVSSILLEDKIQWHVHKGEVVHNRTAGDLR